MMMRQYLCKNDSWKNLVGMPEALAIQTSIGFLCLDPERLVRVECEMIRGSICQASIIIESKNIPDPLNYLIPPEDLEDIFTKICLKPIITLKKYSYATETQFGLHRQNWALNVYEGDNEGLILNSVEVESKDQEIIPAEWVGDEITNESEYSHAALTLMPYKTWVGAKLGKILKQTNTFL